MATTKCETYNLSSGKTITLQDLLNIITIRAEKTIGVKSKKVDCKSKKKSVSIFEISNAKIESLGVHISADISKEIDRLLLNCSKWF